MLNLRKETLKQKSIEKRYEVCYKKKEALKNLFLIFEPSD